MPLLAFYTPKQRKHTFNCDYYTKNNKQQQKIDQQSLKKLKLNKHMQLPKIALLSVVFFLPKHPV